MRVRKKKNSAARMAVCAPLLTEEPRAAFAPGRPLFVEIGCGKGKFISALAKRTPQADFIAVERISDVILLAMERVAQSPPPNLRFYNGSAESLAGLLNPASLDGIYLNFSDPWPKARHEKRRLTYKTYLDMYARLLRPGGAVIMKTDNRPLFEYSLAEFALCGWNAEKVTFDLHSLGEPDNIMTEYEETFSAKGATICRAVFHPNDTAADATD